MDEYPTQSFYLDLFEYSQIEAVVALIKPGVAPQFEIKKYLLEGEEVDLTKKFGLTLEGIRHFEKKVIDEALEFWNYDVSDAEDDIDIWEYDE